MKRLLISLSVIALAGCTAKSTNSVRNQKISRDVVFSTVDAKTAEMLSEIPVAADDVMTVDACFEHIKEVACVSDQKDSGFDPNCSASAVTPEMLAHVPKIISEFPEIHRKVFCTLKRFQIQPNIESLAYAGQVFGDNYKIIGSMVGVRADAITGQKSDHDIYSWKEQLNFGLSKMGDQTYTISPNGPRIVMGIPNTDDFLVQYVLIHEVSHLVDFMNTANHADYQKEDYGYQTKEYPDSFALLSWPEKNTVVYSQEGSYASPEWRAMSPQLSKFCYYLCTKTIPVEEMAATYEALRKSTFMTAYSTSNDMEDFADSSAMYFLRERGYLYKILGPAGETLFDLDEAWKSPAVQPKLHWLKKFYSRTDLKSSFDP